MISIEMIRQSLSVNILREDVEPICTGLLTAMHAGQAATLQLPTQELVR
jgi:hypothetical protein